MCTIEQRGERLGRERAVPNGMQPRHRHETTVRAPTGRRVRYR
jgi:hypothetical protein